MKIDERKFFGKSIASNSIKLLIVNTLLYLVFLQAFVLGSLTEQFNQMDLPLFTYFSGGLFALFYILIWYNLGELLYEHVKSGNKVFQIALISEVPFILIIAALWYVFANLWSYADDTVKILMLVITLYLIIYPAALVLSRTHGKQARKLEK